MIHINCNHLFNHLSLFLLFATSCTSTEPIPEQHPDEENSELRQISLSGSVEERARSRAYWTEDANTPASETLLFNWENDHTGSMKSIIMGKDRIKPFTDAMTAGTTIHTTNNRLKSQLKVADILAPGTAFEPGDEIHCFYPVDNANSTLNTTSDHIHYSFSTPATIVQDEANSTHHLTPYIYMKGKGEVNIADQKALSEVNFHVLPAVIQYRVTNEDELALTIRKISLSGSLAMKGDLKISRNRQEELSFTEAQETIDIQSNLTLQSKQTINYYTLLLPTQFTEAEQLIFNMEGSYSNGWTANYTEIPIDCKALTSNTNQFASNLFYTLEIAVTRDEIAMNLGDVSIEQVQKGEDTQIEIGPKN